MDKIQYVPVIGNGLGNETPFVMGNPYRRIRQDKRGWFILVKGEKVYTQSLFPESVP